MKNFLTLALLFSLTIANAQEKTIPAVDIKTMDQKPFNTQSIENDGKPIIISFWATWCSPCKKELVNIAEVYDEWIEETGVKLIAVSIDDSRNVQKVAPYVNSQSWEYLVLLDENADFKRAMNVNNVPHTFLIDGKGNIVWQHNSYSEGDENELYDLVKKLAKGEDIKHE